MNNFFNFKKVSAYLFIVSLILAIVPVIYVLGKVNTVSEYLPTLIFIALSVAVDLAIVFLPVKIAKDILLIISALLKSLAFSFFMLGGVLSLADYIAKINLFGDASQVPFIIIYGVALLISAGTAIADCYIKN